jgi:hypothetical protein
LGGRLDGMATNANLHGIRADYADGLVIEGLTLEGQNRPIRVQNGRNARVVRCTVRNAGGKAIAITQCPEGLIADCVVEGTNQDDGQGIYVSYPRSTDCVVRGCTVTEAQGGGIKISRGASGCRIEGCTIRASAVSTFSAGYGIMLDGARDCVVTGCEMYMEARIGIFLQDHPAATATDQWYATDNVFTGCVVKGLNGVAPSGGLTLSSHPTAEHRQNARNKFVGCTFRGQVTFGSHTKNSTLLNCNIISGGTCVLVDGASGGTFGHAIIGCHIESIAADGRGIYAHSGSTDILVEGCTVLGNGSTNTNGGIQATGVVSRWRINGNRVMDWPASIAIFCQNGNGAVTASTIANNVVRNCGKGITLRRRGTVSGNVLSNILDGIADYGVVLEGLGGSETGEAYGNGPGVTVHIIGV